MKKDQRTLFFFGELFVFCILLCWDVSQMEGLLSLQKSEELAPLSNTLSIRFHIYMTLKIFVSPTLGMIVA